MHDFLYRDGKLFCEEIPVDRILDAVGTPAYVYSARTIVEHCRKIREAYAGIEHLVCYSVKANSSRAILRMLRDEGAGFDVVSGGELYRVLQAGGDPRKTIYAGVGKTAEEIRYALDQNILMFNLENPGELEVIDRIARDADKVADLAIRVNPDVDPKTHRYITTGKRETKFGIDLDQAEAVARRLSGYPGVRLIGVHMHIGSQITTVEPYVRAAEKVTAFIGLCRGLGHPVTQLNIGGGFGIFYKDKSARTMQDFSQALLPVVRPTGCRLLMEPGRFIVGNAGVLLTQVLFLKESGDRAFVICDAGMNDLIRPALYEAYHKIWPIQMPLKVQGEPPDEESWTGPSLLADVVGPICESGDFFARDRRIPPVQRGDRLAVFSAGAYGYAMSSNYNSHPRPAEVLVRGDQFALITARESYADLVRNER
ncbi:MAG: diaminopimelate decarboxylase [Planctomycetes bacterium]|nr:diaminopimelate decarboxylase [Planctomycetota bacterium]